MASFVARFECSICQGTLEDASFCSLNCGHCFHTVCAHQWLERSPTCPSCRASAKKRQVRALTGIDAVQDVADAAAAGAPWADQQQVRYMCWGGTDVMSLTASHCLQCGAVWCDAVNTPKTSRTPVSSACFTLLHADPLDVMVLSWTAHHTAGAAAGHCRTSRARASDGCPAT